MILTRAGGRPVRDGATGWCLAAITSGTVPLTNGDRGSFTMDVQQDQADQFRQFQAGHLERQTKALERQARDIGAIRAVVTIWLLLTVLGALIFIVLSASAGSGGV